MYPASVLKHLKFPIQYSVVIFSQFVFFLLFLWQILYFCFEFCFFGLLFCPFLLCLSSLCCHTLLPVLFYTKYCMFSSILACQHTCFPLLLVSAAAISLIIHSLLITCVSLISPVEQPWVSYQSRFCFCPFGFSLWFFSNSLC